MALSNRDRVGKALELLGRALGPYVDLRMSKRSPMGGNWKATYADVNVDEDPSAQISVVLDNWQAVFRDELRTTGRNLIGEVRDWRNKWAHNEPFSLDDAYRALDTIERLLTVIGAPDAATEVGAAKSELMRQRLDAEAKKAAPKPDALFTEPSGGFGRGGMLSSPTTTSQRASSLSPNSRPTSTKCTSAEASLSTQSLSSSSGAPT